MHGIAKDVSDKFSLETGIHQSINQSIIIKKPPEL